MMYKLAMSRVSDLLASFGKVIAPIERAEQVNFGAWSPEETLRLDVLKTVNSAKDAFFPQSEDIVHFKMEGKNIAIGMPEKPDEPFVLFGVRACDARSFDVVSIRYDGDWEPLTCTPGQWTMSRSGDGCVVTGRGMDDARSQMQHCMNVRTTEGDVADGVADGAEMMSMVVSPIENHSEIPGFTPNVRFTRLGERGLYAAVILPSADSAYAHADQLPVLMKPYGGPGFQQVVESQSFYWDAQWWADQGYIVVTADGRGTTGRGPKWDRAIYENMKAVTLEDQVDAVHALPDAIASLAAETGVSMPKPDLDKVAMIGWSYGGFLSALAVLDAPDAFAAACAGAPPTDWTLYDTHYTERYLGLDPATYERNSIVADAPKLSRPLMLIHGFADDNVTIANSLRLSQALMAAGRKHTFLPLNGITHMTNDETVARNLLLLQRDFLADALA